MISPFDTFRDLLLHCLKLHDSGQSQEALAAIDEYLGDPRASKPSDPFWSDYNVQQALGFRIAFLEKADASASRSAEHKYIWFCTGHLHYWLSASADAHAHLAMSYFAAGLIPAGRKAAKEAIRLAGTLGEISGTVARAAEEVRKLSNQ
jgi:hypothetical protein